MLCSGPVSAGHNRNVPDSYPAVLPPPSLWEEVFSSSYYRLPARLSKTNNNTAQSSLSPLTLFSPSLIPSFSFSDLRASRQSLMEDGRRSRATALQRSMSRKSTRQSTRSRSRDKLASASYRDNRSRDGDRGSSGYRSRDGDSLPDSDNWATSTDNNWTDYDQEVYTVRSPQKSNRYSRDDVNL